MQFLPQSFRPGRLLRAWLRTRANVELRRYQRVIGDDGRTNLDRASCSTLEDDNVQHVTRAMCRTDGVLDQISTIEDVLENLTVVGAD